MFIKKRSDGKYELVVSKRVPGKKNPKHTVLANLGKHDNIGSAIAEQRRQSRAPRRKGETQTKAEHRRSLAKLEVTKLENYHARMYDEAKPKVKPKPVPEVYRTLGKAEGVRKAKDLRHAINNYLYATFGKTTIDDYFKAWRRDLLRGQVYTRPDGTVDRWEGILPLPDRATPDPVSPIDTARARKPKRGLQKYKNRDTNYK